MTKTAQGTSAVCTFVLLLVGCGPNTDSRVAVPNAREVVASDSQSGTSVDRFSEKEIAVYAAAFRNAIYNYAGGGDGIIFLQAGEQDPPPELLGRIFRPASRAHLADREKPTNGFEDQRIFDKVTREPGTIITVTIVEWIGDDRVKIECESYTDPLWAGGCKFYLRLKEGEWIADGDDPDSYWVS